MNEVKWDPVGDYDRNEAKKAAEAEARKVELENQKIVFVEPERARVMESSRTPFTTPLATERSFRRLEQVLADAVKSLQSSVDGTAKIEPVGCLSSSLVSQLREAVKGWRVNKYESGLIPEGFDLSHLEFSDQSSHIEVRDKTRYVRRTVKVNVPARGKIVDLPKFGIFGALDYSSKMVAILHDLITCQAYQPFSGTLEFAVKPADWQAAVELIQTTFAELGAIRTMGNTAVGGKVEVDIVCL